MARASYLFCYHDTAVDDPCAVLSHGDPKARHEVFLREAPWSPISRPKRPSSAAPIDRCAWLTVGRESNRFPFRSMLRPCILVPNACLASGPLRLSVGEFYSRLVLSMLHAGEKSAIMAPPAFSHLQPWLGKINEPALACMTAQRVAAGVTR